MRESLTMYIQNRRNSSKFEGCSALQLLNGLIGWSSEIPPSAYCHPLYLYANIRRRALKTE